jgi:hypothetical protein
MGAPSCKLELLTWAAVAGLAAIGVAPSVHAQVTPQAAPASMCLPADEKSALLITVLRNWVTTTDPQKIADRDQIFHIPVVPPPTIALVTDKTICAKGSKAYATRVKSPVAGPVYVIQMGSGNSVWYLVHDPTPAPSGGEFNSFIVFDKRWNRYGGWSG